MLRHLHVENYALIDSLDIAFPEGLIIISGQTGAGKSILLGALSLALGAKADAAAIGSAGDTCVVEAEFSVDDAVADLLRENDLDAGDGILLVRRVLSRSGRSRSFVNDEPVAVGVLQALSERLVDIHSQHQTLRLQDPAFRLSLLDHFCLHPVIPASAVPASVIPSAPSVIPSEASVSLLTACREHWKRLQELRKQLSGVEERLTRLNAEKTYNEAQYEQLAAAKLREGELEQLEQEQRELAHAAEIRELLESVREGLEPSDGRSSLIATLKEAGRSLGKAAHFIPALKELEDRLESARLEVDDILGEVEDASARTEVSPARLEAVEERLSLLYGLFQKHGVRTEAELIALRESLSQALYGVTELEEERASLVAELAAARKQYDDISAALHASREGASESFAKEVERLLGFLELDKAVFGVVLSEHPEGPSGKDGVQFVFSAGGDNPRDITKVASGGELSRIMLCLKAMMTCFQAMPTLIFDEIDTGVSGSAADKMGSLICQMGERMQVVAITHQPQVAAKGEAHYLVTKTGDRTAIRRLDRDDRVQELARMLSGSVITEAAIANAESLLNA